MAMNASDSDEFLFDHSEPELESEPLDGLNPFYVLTVVSGVWLVVWTAMFAIVQAVIWVGSFFR